MNNTGPLPTFLALLGVLFGIKANSYEEIDLSAIDFKHASCDIRASESSPWECYGLYEMRDVLVDKARPFKVTFLGLILRTDPFITIIRNAIKIEQKLEFQYHFNNWFAGDDKSLFYRVFEGLSVNDRLLRTGYVASYNRHYYHQDHKLESDNCQKESFCVKGICRKDTLAESYTMITMVEGLSPAFEFTLFTLAILKMTGPIKDHHITYRIKNKFFTQDILITVEYKKSSKEYSPENVQTVYYLMMRNQHVGVDYICDGVSTINLISIEGLMQRDWICGFYSSMSFYECAGRRNFGRVARNLQTYAKQWSFIREVLSLPSFSYALGHALGPRKSILLKELWFGEDKYFGHVFVNLKSQQRYLNGYIPFFKAISPSNKQLMSSPGKTKCDERGNGFITVDYDNLHLVFLKEVNPLFDFTLLTLASMRALMSEKTGELVYRTQNPRDRDCFVDIQVIKSVDKNHITDIRYISADK